jgi:hypothetical protein
MPPDLGLGGSLLGDGSVMLLRSPVKESGDLGEVGNACPEAQVDSVWRL